MHPRYRWSRSGPPLYLAVEPKERTHRREWKAKHQNLLVIAAKNRGFQCCLEDVEDESRLGTLGFTDMEALSDPGKINFTETVSIKVLRRRIGPKEVQDFEKFCCERK